ncbi:MAG: SDR family NAD(P)-dependent oxidoreductase [Proteobacteria bacterium]|nr:SDR family NAD(P)-dependent oxidoreductase [Pseudomonadota bacterium]MBI3497522.1 SDR family NAD(P)-dependent oxidoreductase [Pseudomonadota bacterium]
MDKTAARVAWITGASSGIGRALALRLASTGYLVAASARGRAALEALSREAKGKGGQIAPYRLDVTDVDACRKTVEAIESALGPIGLVVLNAGSHKPVSAERFDAEVFRQLFATNVQGVVNGLAAVIPRLIRRKRGHIAIVSSVAGFRGLPTAAAYGASKAALINMAEALKFDLDRLGIKVQLITPGFVRTPLTDRNPFPMPFIISAEEAAKRITRGLASNAFEISFPRRLACSLKLLRLLPDGLYFPLMHRATGL